MIKDKFYKWKPVGEHFEERSGLPITNGVKSQH